MIANAQQLVKLDFKSTLYHRLPPEDRRKLDRAIVDRTHTTYKSCYEHFRLADRGIGFFVFYRYARNLRRLAAVTEISDARSPEENDPVALNEAISRLLTDRLIESLDDETADSQVLHRLVRAYDRAIRVQKVIHHNAKERRAHREKTPSSRPETPTPPRPTTPDNEPRDEPRAQASGSPNEPR
ncbi:MAG: DUF3486 family protein [Planctomycetota bacterium]|nr:DUF3486 family protein [Planctomycetota bacterium]